MLDFWQEFANGTETVENTIVSGYDRWAFGWAVSFHNANSETFYPHVAGVRLDGFGTAKHKADVVKVYRMGDFGVTAEESVGSKHNAGSYFIHNFGDDAIVERGRV